MSRTVVLAGATGLVGGHLLQMLLDDPAVVDVHRADPPPAGHPAPEAGARRRRLRGAGRSGAARRSTTSSAASGTTMARAGSQQAFREVDLVLAAGHRRDGAGRRRDALLLRVVDGCGSELAGVLQPRQGRTRNFAGGTAISNGGGVPAVAAGRGPDRGPCRRTAGAGALRPLGALIPASTGRSTRRPSPRAMLLASHGDAMGRFVVESDDIRRATAGREARGDRGRRAAPRRRRWKSCADLRLSGVPRRAAAKSSTTSPAAATRWC